MKSLTGFDRRFAVTCLSLAGLLVLAPQSFAQDGAEKDEGSKDDRGASGGTPVSLLPGLLPAQATADDEADDEVSEAGSPAVAIVQDGEGEDGEEEDGEGEDVEELVVTGTRIRRKDLATAAPVTVVDAQAINASGLVTIGQILQNLPSQANGINVQFNNGGTGATRVNLRGIGAARTLVLLNGRRIVPGGLGANASVDLNLIPIEIIDRMEVLRDGSSAVYGSDAIGGVVNIITKKDFSGIEGRTYYGSSQHGGPLFQATVTAGEVTEKASFLVSGQYFRQDPLFAGERDFSRSDLAYDYQSGDQTTLGSSAPPEGNIIDRGAGGPGNATWQGVNGRFGGLLHNDNEDGWRRLRLTGNSDVGEGDFYNYQPENYLITPSERFSLYTQGEFALSESINFYAEGLYAFRESERLLAPEPLFTLFVGDGITVSGDNVYNPFGRDFIDVRRRMVEQANRQFTATAHTFRIVAGVEGELPEGWGKLSTWKWDFNFNFGRTEAADVSRGVLSASRVQNAVGPSFIDETLTARCGTPDNPIAGCVPLNLFGGPGTITDEQIDYVSWTGTDRGFSEQRIFTFETGGEVFDLWDRAAAVVVGFQQRTERGGQIPNAIESLGDSTGNNAQATEGEYSEIAGYIELGVPLLADLPLVELLEVSAALRVFDFDTFGTDVMYKIGGVWKIYSDVSLRGNYSRAFRAPSVAELFAGASDSFPSVTDPCDESGGEIDPSTELGRRCIAQGAPIEGQTFATGQTQIRTLVGGNEALGPETADVITAGLVWEPKFADFLRGFSLTVDYFNIAIDNAIQTVGADIILANCYTNPDQQSCDQIARNASGLVTQIDDRNTNIGGFDTSGIDMSVRYQKGTPIGRFGFSFDGVYVNEFLATQPDGSQVSGLDQYDLGNTNLGFMPSWRFNTTIQWAFEGAGLGYNVRYIRGVRECGFNVCDEAEGNPLTRGVDPNVTMDLFASYSFTNPLGYTSLRAGINNLTDQTPPTIYAGFLANSDAANYDYLGRFFYVGLRHRL